MKILIIGKGFIGFRAASTWPNAVVADTRIRSVADVHALLDEHQPDVVLNAAGVRGKPNVDWCETNQRETIAGNTILPLLIADACHERGIYMLHLATGCIFYGDAPDSAGWREHDHANPVAVYSKTKYAADLALSTLPQVGIARFRMPIDWLPSEGNLIDKLARYPKIIDVENSVTILDDLIEVLRQLLEKRAAGIFHVTNPGTLKHREIIALYHELVDPTHTNEWITEEDLVTQGLAVKKRSNNFMQSSNLEKLGIKMRPISEAIRDTMKKYAEQKQNKNQSGRSSTD